MNSTKQLTSVFLCLVLIGEMGPSGLTVSKSSLVPVQIFSTQTLALTTTSSETPFLALVKVHGTGAIRLWLTTRANRMGGVYEENNEFFRLLHYLLDITPEYSHTVFLRREPRNQLSRLRFLAADLLFGFSAYTMLSWPKGKFTTLKVVLMTESISTFALVISIVPLVFTSAFRRIYMDHYTNINQVLKNRHLVSWRFKLIVYGSLSGLFQLPRVLEQTVLHHRLFPKHMGYFFDFLEGSLVNVGDVMHYTAEGLLVFFFYAFTYQSLKLRADFQNPSKLLAELRARLWDGVLHPLVYFGWVIPTGVALYYIAGELSLFSTYLHPASDKILAPTDPSDIAAYAIGALLYGVIFHLLPRFKTFGLHIDSFKLSKLIQHIRTNPKPWIIVPTLVLAQMAPIITNWLGFSAPPTIIALRNNLSARNMNSLLTRGWQVIFMIPAMLPIMYWMYSNLFFAGDSAHKSDGGLRYHSAAFTAIMMGVLAQMIASYRLWSPPGGTVHFVQDPAWNAIINGSLVNFADPMVLSSSLMLFVAYAAWVFNFDQRIGSFLARYGFWAPVVAILPYEYVEFFVHHSDVYNLSAPDPWDAKAYVLGGIFGALFFDIVRRLRYRYLKPLVDQAA